MSLALNNHRNVKMKFITIIPAYNEENAIESVVKCALKYSDVLVVDDGSTDNTHDLAKKTGADVVKHQKNMGKGAAIKSGLKKALIDDYDFFILLDGDGQHNPECIPLFISDIECNELVIGSRFKGNDPKDMPIQRRFSNKITTSLMRYVTGYRLTDSQSGFRAISRSAAGLFMDIKYDDYIYESEMLYKASKNNIKVEEISIPCTYGNEESHVNKIHVLRYMLFIIRLLGRKLKIRVLNEPVEVKWNN